MRSPAAPPPAVRAPHLSSDSRFQSPEPPGIQTGASHSPGKVTLTDDSVVAVGNPATCDQRAPAGVELCGASLSENRVHLQEGHPIPCGRRGVVPSESE